MSSRTQHKADEIRKCNYHQQTVLYDGTKTVQTLQVICLKVDGIRYANLSR